MRIGKLSVENVRFYLLIKRWSDLSDLEKDLVFAWMIGAGEYLESEEMFEKLSGEIKNMCGTFI
jgi:hypothetical protein